MVRKDVIDNIIKGSFVFADKDVKCEDNTPRSKLWFVSEGGNPLNFDNVFFIDDTIEEHIHNLNYLKENVVNFKTYNAFFLDCITHLMKKLQLLLKNLKMRMEEYLKFIHGLVIYVL